MNKRKLVDGYILQMNETTNEKQRREDVRLKGDELEKAKREVMERYIENN